MTVKSNLLAKSVFEKLPSMSMSISDPARHEKILSFVINQELEFAGEELDHALSNLQDDRVVSLALRLIAVLVQKTPSIFSRIIQNHQLILEYIVEFASCNSSDIIKFGYLETLAILTKNPCFVEWAASVNLDVYQFAENSFLANNLFITNSSIRLLATSRVRNTAIFYIDIVKGLDLLLELIKNDKVEYDFALEYCLPLVNSTDKLTRQRAETIFMKLATAGQINESILHVIGLDFTTFGWLRVLLRLSNLLRWDILNDLTGILHSHLNPELPIQFHSGLAKRILSKKETNFASFLIYGKYLEKYILDENSSIRTFAVACLSHLLNYPNGKATLVKNLEFKEIVCNMIVKETESAVIPALLGFVVKQQSFILGFVDTKIEPPPQLENCYQNEDFIVRESYVGLLELFVVKSLETDTEINPKWHAQLLALIDDPSRFVRSKALVALKGILDQYQYKSKRQYGSVSNAFLLDCQKLDIDALLLRCEPEELYQEDFDMGDDIIDEADERGQGNNVLFCYDC
ncbi:hypothetical protein HDV01_006976 [Terramyces sp. JEL0728]|nr:hypothetical protein HDV01_006976 [Terramyces sp. JEL0728]